MPNDSGPGARCAREALCRGWPLSVILTSHRKQRMPVREEAADCASVEAVSPQTLEVPQTQLPTAKETEVVDELDLNDRALFEMVSLTREITR
jgi:hypothetical protein